MRGRVVLVMIVGLGVGGCGKKSEPAPSLELSPAKVGSAAGPSGAPVLGPKDTRELGSAAPRQDPPPPPDPIASLFEVSYEPGETLPEKMRRRIRYQLRDRSKAPIALHHVIDVPRPDGGHEVFALYEYSAYEECVQGYPTRKEGRDHCLGELADVSDGVEFDGMRGYRQKQKQIRLNGGCIALGAVHAVFGPPGPGTPADQGGALTVTSMAFSDELCQVRDYNRMLVADLDRDQKLELYLDLTTAREETGEVRGGFADTVVVKMYQSRRHLYVLSGGEDTLDAAVSLDLASAKLVEDLPFEELIELRDVNGDKRLDLVQIELCMPERGPSASPAEVEVCDWDKRKRVAHVYDADLDGYREQDLPGAKPAEPEAPGGAEGAAKPAKPEGAPDQAGSAGAAPKSPKQPEVAPDGAGSAGAAPKSPKQPEVAPDRAGSAGAAPKSPKELAPAKLQGDPAQVPPKPPATVPAPAPSKSQADPAQAPPKAPAPAPVKSPEPAPPSAPAKPSGAAPASGATTKP